MAVLRVAHLPAEALAAAAQFHAEVLPGVVATLRELIDQSPLPFRGGAGGGACLAGAEPTESPHPNPSPKEEGLLVLIFTPADHSHRAWRLAAVQSLAREFAPVRVNAVTSGSEAAVAAALAFLGSAEGITGQLLELDDTGAGEVVSSKA